MIAVLVRLPLDSGPKSSKMTSFITQSPEWAQFRLKTPNVKKVLEIDGCQIFVHKIPLLPWTIAYLPRPEKLGNLEEIKKACQKEKAIFLKVEPTIDYRPSTTDHKISNPVLPHHTIYIDLTKTEDELLAAMHEKTRYNIRLAEKKGVVIKNEDSLEAVGDFIHLLEQTEERQGFYSHPAQYYRTLWRSLRPAKMVYLLSAYAANTPNTPIAAIMLFRYQDTLYYPYGGSNPKYRKYMAPHLLHWEAIKLGKKLGCKIYDLWGSYKDFPTESDPWWGTYRFKKGFGGQEITLPPTIDILLSPLYPLYLLSDSLRWQFLRLKRLFTSL